jgi:hypothetical protein
MGRNRNLYPRRRRSLTESLGCAVFVMLFIVISAACMAAIAQGIV